MHYPPCLPSADGSRLQCRKSIGEKLSTSKLAGLTACAGFSSDRKEQIRSIVHQRGLVRNSELSNLMGVSTVTIRQDLEQLESHGLLRRTYGGAAAIAAGTPDSAFSIRSALHSEAKRRIGAAAAAMILPGETIVLDAGTTTIEIARQLPADSELTVVTCAGMSPCRPVRGPACK